MRTLLRGPSRRRPSLAGALGAVALLGLAACIIIPTNFHTAGSRENVSDRTLEKLQVGTTTKEEVFLQLGEPDHISPDGRRLGYAWSKVKAIVFVGGGYSGDVAAVTRSYLLQLSFDEHDRLTAANIVKHWGDEIPATAVNAAP